MRFVVPEHGLEVCVQVVGDRTVLLGSSEIRKQPAQILERTQCVVPKRLNLYGAPGARSDRDVADLGVHPGELSPVVAGPEEAIVVGADSVARTCDVVLRDALERGVEAGLDQLQCVLAPGRISPVVEVLPDRLKEPEGGIAL